MDKPVIEDPVAAAHKLLMHLLSRPSLSLLLVIRTAEFLGLRVVLAHLPWAGFYVRRPLRQNGSVRTDRQGRRYSNFYLGKHLWRLYHGEFLRLERRK